MRSIVVVVILFSIAVGCQTVSGQILHDYGFKLGLEVNGLLPATEFWDSHGMRGSYLVRGLGRIELGNRFQMEVGGGYGSMSGLDFNGDEYRTELIPLDARLLFNILGQEKKWNPYLYAGVGVMSYRVKDFPGVVSPKPVDAKGITGIIPAGVGVELAVADAIALYLHAGVIHTFTDNLNYYKFGEPTDGSFIAGLGLVFATGGTDADPDGDRLLTSEENVLGTNPNKRDTDDDGLWDGEELHTYKTDPLRQDSDGDGFPDGEEIKKYRTDPNKVDTDGDGIPDNEEVLRYKTSPVKPDTDEDGLTDGEEILQYKTDFLNADTDSDGLTDGDEVLKYKTDPQKKDTDGGSASDGVEVARSTNPLNPDDDTAPKDELAETQVGEAIVLDGIVFETGKSTIRPESESILEKAYNTLSQHPEIVVEVRGYTDNTGQPLTNFALSLDRADAVKNFLIQKGISPERLTSKGFGHAHPIASNRTAEGRQKNRRIEFYRIQ